MLDTTYKVLITMWIISFIMGTFAFYIPHEKSLKISIVLGMLAMIVFPFIIGAVAILSSIWR